MSLEGFEDYLHSFFDKKNGTINSYITAINIIDEMLANDKSFDLKGKSIACIDDDVLLQQIAEYVCKQQTLFKARQDSLFRNINANQRSYPDKGFCSAAIKHLLKYNKTATQADTIIKGVKKGTDVSKKLSLFFKIDKEGGDVLIQKRERIGQSYFRRMVLTNYDNKCCVTGLNIPQTLRASHIVAWAENKAHRMDPENGLCLSATYDAAFDKKLISFDEDYRMIISKEVKDYYTNDVVRDYFGKYEGKKIILPKLYLPSQELLEIHRNSMSS